MNQLLEWSPFLVFFAVYKLKDIYWATAALMIACLVQLIVHRARSGKFKTMHLVTFAVVLVLGTATLALHDRRFIQWKPTVLLGCASVVFLGSMFIGKQPLVRRMLEGVFDEPVVIAPRAWILLNSLWVIWLALLAVLNLYVAWNFAEATWVNFKLFGISIALFVFMVPQVFWLQGKTQPATPLPTEADLGTKAAPHD
jgi:intracellular septation protein